MIRYSEFERKARASVGHNVEIVFKNGAPNYKGYCCAFSRAIDNEPELSDVTILNSKGADFGIDFNEAEVEDIIILD
ncbi:MAG: hypothetical protein MR742_10880 [Clostridiales bacterium]|nr:hypothetical protein [Clostridiales bacterium]